MARDSSFRPWRVALVAGILAASALIATRVSATDNFLTNGDFAKGTDNSPDGWYSESWINLPTTEYAWLGPTGENSGEVVITNHQPNDGRWVQPLHLAPGWYSISAEAMTERVPEDSTGAFVTLYDEGISSFELKGNSNWQRIGFYLKVTGTGAYVRVALRLGGFSNFNTGWAFFRAASVTKINAPLSRDWPRYDLLRIRNRWGGSPWTVVAALILLTLGSRIGWRMFGQGCGDARGKRPPGDAKA